MQSEATDDKFSPARNVWHRVAMFNEYIIAIVLTALVTAISFAVEPVTGHAAAALLYLLLVVAVGMKLHRGPVLLVAASGALVWNFLFIPTRFSFHIAT